MEPAVWTGSPGEHKEETLCALAKHSQRASHLPSANDSGVIHPHVVDKSVEIAPRVPERLGLDDFRALPEPRGNQTLTGEKSANDHDQTGQQGGQPGVAQQSGHAGVCQQLVPEHDG
jgi:hypothetical protein